MGQAGMIYILRCFWLAQTQLKFLQPALAAKMWEIYKLLCKLNLTEKNANFYYSKIILKRTASRIFLERNLTLMPRLRKYCGSNLVLFLSFPVNKCKVLAGKRYHSLKKSYQTPERTTRKVTQQILIKIFVLPKWSYFRKFIKQFI